MSATESPHRFQYVDGLRGLAALAVTLFHLFIGPLVRPLESWTPAVLSSVLWHGYLGVQLFFVLSGYVIAHSLRDTTIDLGSAARFALRRQVRLDPPYWVVLTLAVLDLGLPRLLHPERATPLPSSGQIASHLVYAQHFLGWDDIVTVFWTLCIEVQFYLLFIALLWLATRLARRSGSELVRSPVLGAVLAPLALASLFFLADATDWKYLFLPHWYLFVLGCLTYWCDFRRWSGWALVAFSLAIAGCGAFTGQLAPFAGLATAGLLFASARVPGLAWLFSGRVLQYLGRTSYSLYLVHFTVGYRVLNAGQRLTGDSRPAALGWFALSLLLSLVAAHVLHRWVELPSVALAQRLKTRLLPRTPEATLPGPAR
jgi:peptidoglycan/LPS O-acetylase OafA/YrhL